MVVSFATLTPVPRVEWDQCTIHSYADVIDNYQSTSFAFSMTPRKLRVRVTQSTDEQLRKTIGKIEQIYNMIVNIYS